MNQKKELKAYFWEKVCVRGKMNNKTFAKRND